MTSFYDSALGRRLDFLRRWGTPIWQTPHPPSDPYKSMFCGKSTSIFPPMFPRIVWAEGGCWESIWDDVATGGCFWMPPAEGSRTGGLVDGTRRRGCRGGGRRKNTPGIRLGRNGPDRIGVDFRVGCGLASGRSAEAFLYTASVIILLRRVARSA